MEFDIWNSSKRKVVCVSNDSEGMIKHSHNHPLLEVGKEYTVVDVEVHSWHTVVYLEEFPSKGFNSVAFNEVGERE